MQERKKGRRESQEGKKGGKERHFEKKEKKKSRKEINFGKKEKKKGRKERKTFWKERNFVTLDLSWCLCGDNMKLSMTLRLPVVELQHEQNKHDPALCC